MKYLLLLLCLAPQDQTAEAKKLLDALAPPLKDPSYYQLEWTRGSKTGVGYFDRQKAWRVDTKLAGGETVNQWDGKTYLVYSKHNNQYFKNAAEPKSLPFTEGGALADIYNSGNSDRLLKDAKKVTITTEKLDEVDCTHIIIFKGDGGGVTDREYHVWIAAGTCKRYTRKYKSNGRPDEESFTYKVVDPPTITEATFAFKPPADARDMKSR